MVETSRTTLPAGGNFIHRQVWLSKQFLPARREFLSEHLGAALRIWRLDGSHGKLETSCPLPIHFRIARKPVIPVLHGKPRPFKDRQRCMSNGFFDHNRARGQARDGATEGRPERARREGSSESNKTNFQELGAASPENFIFGLIRVYSLNSWCKYPSLGHPSRTGSFVFPADQDV